MHVRKIERNKKMSNGHKVLLVDDESTVLSVISLWLEEAGYRVRCAEDGNEAIIAINAECPDILITDWQMPNMDGIELCRWLRSQNLPKEVYTLFLTIVSDVEKVVEALHAGANDFLSKPANKWDLIARVNVASRRLETSESM